MLPTAKALLPATQLRQKLLIPKALTTSLHGRPIYLLSTVIVKQRYRCRVKVGNFQTGKIHMKVLCQVQLIITTGPVLIAFVHLLGFVEVV